MEVFNAGRFYWVADNVIGADFPEVSSALRNPDGLLAIGGDLEPATLLTAYRRGIFPWYSEGQPLLWWSPDPRCVLEPDQVRINRSLARTLKRNTFKVSFNQAFADVVRGCSAPRGDDTGTWITTDMAAAYLRLHHLGHALSCECWHESELAGGLYGVVIGKVFFGESMFSRKTDASKVALVRLAQLLRQRRFRLIDCQIHSPHLERLGAKSMARDDFVGILKHYCSR
ncbi:MAG: leucyl/phenylalanyl-tRNA--protein transferase [Gammaproteobacteria bacterium]|nr:leucyl/phenylalanyl-tRNA--protein transferase [Gammaproteobacteria bacterium]MCY4282006.1 leucyl/phenylalanyl-tRNA--protein transferase [Gammaproteobacteria bacterium]MCY4337215.1 leucyl/phenylalanyl-tRNA--protein transferase [Gammaproteobacteria bacterium]